MRAVPSNSNRKRIRIGFGIMMLILTALIIRLAWIQIINVEYYTNKAISQQTKDSTIESSRGDILDRNGKELATSISCYNMIAQAKAIQESYSSAEIKVMAEEIAEVTEGNSSDIFEKLTSDSMRKTVLKYLDKDVVSKIRALGYSGLEFENTNRRYYPLGTLASHILGSVSDDGDGRTGLELQYDQNLKGVSGRWIKNTDLYGNELVGGTSEYYEATEGANIVLTIDEAIQYYVEKEIESAYEKWDPEKVECLVMDPKTGEILASAVYPNFDPNDPYTPQNMSKKELEKYKQLDNTKKTEYLSKMWRNPIVSDTYEPGSTFKLITAASAIEEKAISLSDTFSCHGSFVVADYRLHCWISGAHGTQNIKEAIANSCNPALAAVAKKLGASKFRKYIDLFGFSQNTGIDYPGETSSLIQEHIGPVELATMGFGQGISVTPLQLLTAVSSFGNNGILMQPHLVKAFVDNDGDIIKSFEPVTVRKVVSKKTAEEMCDIMEYEVSEGGGGNAKIPGYRVGGKTGTAEKAGKGGYTDKYYSSFLGMAPMDDPQVSILVIVDSAKGARYGSVIAAPIAKNILSSILRYKNIEPQYSAEELERMNTGETTVPNVVGKPFSDAAGIVGGRELKYSRPDNAMASDDWTVVDQYPKAGSKVGKNTVVYLYKE